MENKEQKPESSEANCPLLNFPCPQGEARAEECCMRFSEEFDPMLNARDFSMLQCATERAKKFQESTIKFWY
jgi:hypothetical protein